MRSQPWILSWSTRIRPPVLAPLRLVMAAALAGHWRPVICLLDALIYVMEIAR
jgi:hypothetical protein